MLTLLQSEWPACDHPRGVDLFIREAEARSELIEEPDFVPSDYALVWDTFSALPVGSLCEWGCGLGVVAGMATMLGWRASGIEQNTHLASMGRDLHRDFGLPTDIFEGDIFAGPVDADVIYAYMWPHLIDSVKQHFAATAPPDARLLLHDAAGRMELFGM